MESAECKLSDLGPSPGEPDSFMSDFHLTYKTSHERALYNELLCKWTRDVRRETGVSGKAMMIFRYARYKPVYYTPCIRRVAALVRLANQLE